jgi:DNA-directed RNA polymerase subunit L
MKPSVQKIRKEGDTLYFTLSNVDVSIANAIRRTALSDIPTVVFRTGVEDEKLYKITTNTSRLNNEIIKQRLSCIPVHVKNPEKFHFKDYQVEVDVENISDTILFVTTEDFKVKNKVENKYLTESQVRELFPPDPYTGHYIDLVRLRHKVSEQILGDSIQFTCDFSIGTARENGMYNVVSTCSYAFTPDEVKINTELAKKKQELKDEGKTEHEIAYDIKNWLLLDAKRIVEPNSYDFVIQSLGVYDNEDIVSKSVEILIRSLRSIDTLLENDRVVIETSKSTMENSFDIILENEDHTIGKVLEYILFEKFFYKNKAITFCGFTKMHPHDKHGVLRIALMESGDKSIIKKMMRDGIVDLIDIFQAIQARFPHAVAASNDK